MHISQTLLTTSLLSSQTVQCPLCQVKLPFIHFQQHLTHVHSVAQDCVDKLISTVSVWKCGFVVFAVIKRKKRGAKARQWGEGEM